jgi:hypothetical protein
VAPRGTVVILSADCQQISDQRWRRWPSVSTPLSCSRMKQDAPSTYSPPYTLRWARSINQTMFKFGQVSWKLLLETWAEGDRQALQCDYILKYKTTTHTRLFDLLCYCVFPPSPEAPAREKFLLNSLSPPGPGLAVNAISFMVVEDPYMTLEDCVLLCWVKKLVCPVSLSHSHSISQQTLGRGAKK